MEEENKKIEETSVEETTEEVVSAEATAEAVAEEAPVTEAESAAETVGGKDASKDEKEEKPISKKKRIANAVILGVQVAFVLVAIIVCLIVLFNPKDPGEVSPLGIKLLTVNTNSMNGTQKDSFSKNDLVIAKSPKNKGEGLQVGQIISFLMLEEKSQTMIVNSHRIVDVKTDGGTRYITKGDANEINDPGFVRPEDVLAVYAFKIKGVGKVIKFIRDGHNFIYIVIIPLALLLIYNVYLVIQIIMEGKMKKAKAAAAADALSSLSQEDIEKLLAARGIDPTALAKMQGQQDENKSNDQ